jgi:GTPase
VQNLPTTLVAAFRATLEEVAEADLLVHVVDASHPSMPRQIEAVEQVLEEIGAAGRPMILALNKADLLPPGVQLSLPATAAALPWVRISALHGTGMQELLNCISENLLLQFVALDVLIPYNRGELVSQFHQFGTIEHESYEANGTHLRGYSASGWRATRDSRRRPRGASAAAIPTGRTSTTPTSSRCRTNGNTRGTRPGTWPFIA